MLQIKQFALLGDSMEMVVKIQRLIEQSPFKVHVVVEDYKTKKTLISVRSDEVFSSASVIKVPILIGVLKKLQQIGGDLFEPLPITAENIVDFSVLSEQKVKSATLYELLLWMIITSDNTATNVCIDYVGMEQLNHYFKTIGLKETKVQRKMMDFDRQQRGFDNETSASDMQRLFKQIYANELLEHQWNQIALDILCRQRSSESLKRYISDNVKIAHKTGGLDTVDHDVGIVYSDAGDYFIGVFVTEVTNNDEAKQLIGTISKIVYDLNKM
jgi:beta-lactamase class A